MVCSICKKEQETDGFKTCYTCREYQRIRVAERRKNQGREKTRAEWNKYYDENKEILQQQYRERYRKNPEKFIEKSKKYSRIKYGTNSYTRKNICMLCKKPSKTVVHHIILHNIQPEDSKNILVEVCNSCHWTIHNKMEGVLWEIIKSFDINDIVSKIVYEFLFDQA